MARNIAFVHDGVVTMMSGQSQAGCVTRTQAVGPKKAAGVGRHLARVAADFLTERRADA